MLERQGTPLMTRVSWTMVPCDIRSTCRYYFSKQKKYMYMRLTFLDIHVPVTIMCRYRFDRGRLMPIKVWLPYTVTMDISLSLTHTQW